MDTAPEHPLVRLASWARSMAEAADVPDVVSHLTEASLALTGADSAHVSRYDLPTGTVTVLRNLGDLAPWEKTCPVDESYLIADLPQAVTTVESSGSWRGGVGDDATSAADQRLLASIGKQVGASAPVVVSGQVWGEVYVARTASRPFTDAQVAVLEVVAALAATALWRLEGDEQMHRLAHTDALTGLANRRAVDQALETWASNPALAGSISVTICDVNGLKQVNDQHGHLVGDRLLREVGALVSAAAGRLSEGLAARLGGDEFVVIAPNPDPDLVTEVVRDLAVAAQALPLGGGLSCGTARASDLPRSEPTPTSLTRSLMRLADAEQYRHKLAYRRGFAGPVAPPARWQGMREPGFLITRVTRLTERLRADRLPAGERLALVAAELCAAASGAAWWVSKVNLAAGTVVAAHCGTPRPDDARDGEWPEVALDTTEYRLEDYPATARVVTGRSMYVDSLVGDPAERHLLAQTGFSSLVATGGTAADGSTWLVEIYGDAYTAELQMAEPMLQALTSLGLDATFDVRRIHSANGAA